MNPLNESLAVVSTSLAPRVPDGGLVTDSRNTGRESVPPSVFVSVCMDCNKQTRGTPIADLITKGLTPTISHGICDVCKVKWLAEAATMRIAA
jgi:hypothetical protein